VSNSDESLSALPSRFVYVYSLPRSRSCVESLPPRPDGSRCHAN